jgi:acetyl esterase
MVGIVFVRHEGKIRSIETDGLPYGIYPIRATRCRYAERLEAAGTPVTYREFPGQIHAFISLTRVIPQGNECLREVANWLRARLG